MLPLTALRVRLARLSDRAVASDPGLLRFRMAVTTVLTLAVSLGVLYAVVEAAGESFTVAMLGVVVSMIASMAFNGSPPVQRVATAGLMLVIAAAMVTLGAALASSTVGGDVVFVAIMAGATAARRFGPRATVLGMVAFMTYFFALFLGATLSMVPWLIIALVIGTAVSLAATFVSRANPDRQLRHALRAMRARLALLLGVIAAALTAGAVTARDRHRLSRRMDQLSQTILMIDGQLDGADNLRTAVDADELKARLFDLELAAENTAGAWRRAANATTAPLPDAARVGLLEAVHLLRAGLRNAGPAGELTDAETRAERVRENASNPPAYRLLALSIAMLSRAAEHAWAPVVDRVETAPEHAESRSGADSSDAEPDGSVAGSPPEDRISGPAAPDATPVSRLARLSPSTRQAVQVSVAASLAIVAGELLSSARWYWAVIAAFVIYSGTTSRGEILTKGRQRIVGTVAGVSIGAVIAGLVGGNVAASLVLIFVSLFAGFYLMQVSYVFMVLGTSTMLALLYGLLGEFTISLLVTRIEETAIGAAIGVLIAVMVLPTSTRATVGAALRGYLDTLRALVAAVGEHLAGTTAAELAPLSRDVDQQLAALKKSAKPLGSGLLNLHGRDGVRRGLAVLDACDHYARALARAATEASDDAAKEQLRRAADRVTDNLGALAGLVEQASQDGPQHADDLLDAAQTAVDRGARSDEERRRLTAAVRYLRQIDLAANGLARDITGNGHRGQLDGRTHTP